MVKFATAGSMLSNPKEAIIQAACELQEKLDSPPHYILVQMNAALDSRIVSLELQTLFPSSHIHGATSCLGTMTEEGLFMGMQSGLALFGIVANDGDFGVGIAAADPHIPMAEAAISALDKALIDADREGELPDAIWISSSPGQEESIIQALEGRLGPDVPIIGGSAADNDVAGQWSLFNHQDHLHTGCVISVFFADLQMGSAFQSAYVATDHKASVTKVSGRTILELDHQPAAEVYGQWLDQDNFATQHKGGSILTVSTFNPLGRVSGHLGGVDIYTLSHPEAVTDEGGLSVFTDIALGDELHFMEGESRMLINRGSRVCRFAQDLADIQPDDLQGGILVYCGGCMLGVRNGLEKLQKDVKDAMNGKPFITAFTFGEQGQVLAGINSHGNLMVSALVWGAKIE